MENKTIAFDDRNIHLYSDKNEQTCPGLCETGNKGAKSVMEGKKEITGFNWQKTNASTTLDCSTTPAMQTQSIVRRLTPMECERLQGFPDGYTDIKPNGKPTPDGARYKALGNSMGVNCMRWIGMRIQMVEDIINAK